MTEFSLNALIDKALSWKEPDPHVIARRLVPKIPRAERDAILADVLADRVRAAVRMQRTIVPSDEPATQPTESMSSSPVRSEGQSRWARHRYAVAGLWKFKDDLTPEDCEWLADEYEQRAEANARIGESFRRLASRLRAEGVARVGDLRQPPEELAA